MPENTLKNAKAAHAPAVATPSKPKAKPQGKGKSRARARARRPASSSTSDSEPEPVVAAGSDSEPEDDEPESPSEDEDDDEEDEEEASQPAAAAAPEPEAIAKPTRTPTPGPLATPFDAPKWSDMIEENGDGQVETLSFEEFGRTGGRGRGGRGRGRGGAANGQRRELTEEELARKREKAKLARRRRKERLAAEKAAKSQKTTEEKPVPDVAESAASTPAAAAEPASASAPAPAPAPAPELEAAPTAGSSKPKPKLKKQQQRNKSTSAAPADVPVPTPAEAPASDSASVPASAPAPAFAQEAPPGWAPLSPSAQPSLPEPRVNNREAYSARVASDPQYAPRVGAFWQHDQRHYQSGQVGQGGEYAGLRQLGGYWRGDRGGRGRGGGARGRGGVVSDMPSIAKEPTWGHEGFEEMSKVEPPRRGGPPGPSRGGRGGRGGAAFNPHFAAQAPPVSDMQSLSLAGKAPMTTAEALEEVVTREAADRAPVVSLPGSHAPPVHKAPAETREVPPHLQQSARGQAQQSPARQHQQAQQLLPQHQQSQQQLPQQQQQLPHHPSYHQQPQQQQQHDMQQRQQSNQQQQGYYPSASSYLPPGVGVTDSGGFYNLATGAPMGFMPTPAPYYPEQSYYQYSPTPDFRQMYTPSPGRDSPFYPPQAPLGYFVPPRPAQKVMIRAPDAVHSPRETEKQAFEQGQFDQEQDQQQQQQQYGAGSWYGPPAY